MTPLAPSEAFTVPAEQTTPPDPSHHVNGTVDADTDAVVLPHGYSLARLNQVAAMSARGSLRASPPHAEKVDLARFAILEHLYECAQHADTREAWHPCNLLRLGQHAIDQHVEQQHLLHRALADHDVYDSPEGPLVEALAFRQVWSLVEPRHQRALLALAEHQDYETAAEALELAYHAMVVDVYEARRTFLAHWHDKSLQTHRQ